MLLKSLYDYAHSRKLIDDLAFAPKPIRWVIPLDREGNLIGPGPIDTSEDGKRGKEFSAKQTTRPKVAGGIAEFLADGITALFGLDMEPEKDKDNNGNEWNGTQTTRPNKKTSGGKSARPSLTPNTSRCRH